ncbi:MAG: hypothetical protein ACE5JF_09265 [Anaerolineales bacterium]
MTSVRTRVKGLLGELPAVPEAYQMLIANGRQPAGGYDLSRLASELPAWVAAAKKAEKRWPTRRVLVVGSLSWWIEFSTALAAVLAGRGCQVDFGFVPFRRWTEPVSAFDHRRQSAYLRSALSAFEELVGLHDLSSGKGTPLAHDLQQQIDEVSRTDVQYTVGREWLDLQPGSSDREMLDLRRIRNEIAGSSMLELLDRRSYDVVIVPNGSILEFAAVRAAAKWAGVQVVTFEFGEQRERIWIAQNDLVMRQDTSPLWQVCSDVDLSVAQISRLSKLHEARRSGESWEQFKREWQARSSSGSSAVLKQLGLDPNRPIVLLCTNVMGDSLAIDREVFTEGMGDWLAQTVRHFADPDTGQLVVRIHPGEMAGAGYPSSEIVRSALPSMPDHVAVVEPDSDINTYDLIELADLGLVYTTTVGMEMATVGLPVIVAGETHYRGRGFTHDPESLAEYLATIDQLLEPEPANTVDTELAERYAYRFFFDYPFEFPWHLLDFWDDIAERPVSGILHDGDTYDATFHALIGEPVDWQARVGWDA